MREHNTFWLSHRPRGRNDEGVAFFDGHRALEVFFLSCWQDDAVGPHRLEEGETSRLRKALVDGQDRVSLVKASLKCFEEGRARRKIQGDETTHGR